MSENNKVRIIYRFCTYCEGVLHPSIGRVVFMVCDACESKYTQEDGPISMGRTNDNISKYNFYLIGLGKDVTCTLDDSDKKCECGSKYHRYIYLGEDPVKKYMSCAKCNKPLNFTLKSNGLL